MKMSDLPDLLSGPEQSFTIIHRITPIAKPRMTQSDKWKKRPAVLRYRAFKDECRLLRLHVPEACKVTFYIPMPKTWSKKLKDVMNKKPHQQKPDIDNLIKALFDAVLEDDSHIHKVYANKVWVDTTTGGISIEEIK